jgi:hypothetical protein
MSASKLVDAQIQSTGVNEMWQVKERRATVRFHRPALWLLQNTTYIER